MYNSLFSILLLLFYILCIYAPLLHLSVADEIIVIIMETPVVNPVEERERDHFWFTSHSISEPMSINIYNGTIVHVKSTPLLIRQADMLLGLG